MRRAFLNLLSSPNTENSFIKEINLRNNSWVNDEVMIGFSHSKSLKNLIKLDV